jgi:general secretion pathway protein G
MVRPHSRPSAGLTLIEVLIVIVALAILAMLVTPRLMAATRAAREATLRAELRLLRAAVETFRADTGTFPVGLEQLVDTSHRKNPLPTHSSGAPSPLDGYRGPYLTTGDGQLPRDPITGERTWKYDPATGRVRTCSSDTALDGTTYAEW